MDSFSFLRERYISKLQSVASQSTRMTKESILISCLQNNGYETPSLNDNLYLHFKGFTTIEELEEYINCVCIYLDSNAIRKIENLGHMTKLRCLYLSKNSITNIEGLDQLVNLVTLDLSYNCIKKIEGLKNLTNLTTLNMEHNALTDINSLIGLQECPTINCLDLSHNNIDDPNFIELIKELENIASLKLQGNKAVRSIENYRRRLINYLPKLSFLDDRPVYEVDRACAEAFNVGGIEAEKNKREEYQEKKRQEHNNHLIRFREWQERCRAAHLVAIRENREVDLSELLTPPDNDPQSNQSRTQNNSNQEDDEQEQLNIPPPPINNQEIPPLIQEINQTPSDTEEEQL